MKGCLDPNTFINRCRYILFNQGVLKSSEEIDYSVFVDSISVSYKSYQKRAEKKNILFNLSEEEFNTINNNNCYICGKKNSEEHKNGIDRFNNSIGYTIENCRSCCFECNHMKKDLQFSYFIKHLENVYNNCWGKEIPECSSQLKSIKNSGRTKMTDEEKRENARIRKEKSNKKMMEKYGKEAYLANKARKQKEYRESKKST